MYKDSSRMSGLVPFILLLIACQLTFGDVVSPQAEEINYRLPTNAKPSHYVLQLETDLTNFKFTGQVTITVDILENSNNLTLNAKNLTVTSTDVTGIIINANNTKLNVAEAKLEEKSEFLVIKLKEQQLNKSNKVNLTVKFAGELNELNRGYYRSKYFDKNNVKKYVAATHFEPTGARLAFPCWDEPEYKALFDISLIHLKNYTAIANTNPLQSKDFEKDKKITTFKRTPLISTYLVAFVVSDYKGFDNGDKNFQVWTKEQAGAETKLALDMGKKLLEQLDKYTNIPYNSKMEKMHQVTLRDFSPSAMENWGLVTYRETSLLFKEGKSTTASKQSITTVIAHEFAHQWFGNLVSPKWWKYIWLNEGFANYMQYFITNKVLPEWRLNETFVVESLQGNAFVADAVKTVRPMNHDAKSPSEISNLFDSIAYQKAGSVIRMMSHILTEEVFQKGVQNYLAAKKDSAAESNDLLQHLQAAANRTWENVQLNTIMDAWLNKPGYPVVTVSKNKEGNFEISQERFLLDGTKDNTTWWVPLTYTYKTNINSNTAVTKWLKPTENLVLTNEHKNDWVLFNNLQTGYYRVNYDEENWKKLDSYLKSKDYNKIAPINRAQLIDDALNLARASRLNYTVALSLTRFLNQETDYIPWTTAFRNFNFLYNMVRTFEKQEPFEAYLTYIMNKVVKNVGFEAAEKDGDVQKRLRVNVLKWACRANNEECKKFVKTKYEAWLKDPNTSLDVDLKNTILCAGVKTADESAWNTTLTNLLSSTNDEDEKKSLLTIPGCSEDPKIQRMYLNYALDKDTPLSFSSAVQTIISESKGGAIVAMEVFMEKYETIQNLDNAASVIKSSIEAIASGIISKDQYTELTFFVGRHKLESHLPAIGDRVEKNMLWIKTHGSTVEHWLNTQDYSSATSVAFSSFLLVLSVIITRFY